jgi:hypothetical protein
VLSSPHEPPRRPIDHDRRMQTLTKAERLVPEAAPALAVTLGELELY